MFPSLSVKYRKLPILYFLYDNRKYAIYYFMHRVTEEIGSNYGTVLFSWIVFQELSKDTTPEEIQKF